LPSSTDSPRSVHLSQKPRDKSFWGRGNPGRQPICATEPVGTGLLHEEAAPLSRLIDVVNDRFGTDFNQADQLFFDQIVEAAISDAALRQAAAVNPGDKFELVFKNLLETLFVERMDQNEEIFARFMNDKSFQKVVTGWLPSEAYRKLRLPSPGPVPSDEAADANS
jgi:type I restriction enzyme R subunit